MKLLCSILLIQLAVLLPSNSNTVAVNHRSSSNTDQHCCLPMKWHSRMVKANHRTFQRLVPERSEVPETSSDPSMMLDVFVNYRRPRFELRSSLGSSLVFWRGHMWTFRPGAQAPQLMNRVAEGYKPSNGLAPFYFRCLAKENGFERISDTHYRLSELDKSSRAAARFRLGSVTDIYVVPSNGTTGGSPRRRASHSCLLSNFTVSSRYFKRVDDGRSIALFTEADAYQQANGLKPTRRLAWPDQQFTDQLRSFRNYYWALLRNNSIKLSQPHLSVHVPGHLADDQQAESHRNENDRDEV